MSLAGVVTEYLRFGQAEGGLGDIAMLDSMFRALQVGVHGRCEHRCGRVWKGVAVQAWRSAAGGCVLWSGMDLAWGRQVEHGLLGTPRPIAKPAPGLYHRSFIPAPSAPTLAP